VMLCSFSKIWKPSSIIKKLLYWPNGKIFLQIDFLFTVQKDWTKNWIIINVTFCSIFFKVCLYFVSYKLETNQIKNL